ncbi:hypothetical protein [Streptomyces phytophilus]|uniref:hypothetical protein n=1 Tax=Streptomyces phytophilus TaxID=722715 RepID=UPI0015F04D8C|nr:hypothetical protein [Streptomyces phytophilus]
MVSSATPVPEPSAEQALLSLLSCRPASDAKTNQHYVDRFREQVEGEARSEVDRLRAERDRYHNAWHNARDRAASAQADVEYVERETRATVLDEAAERALALRQFEKAAGPRASAQVSENVGILRVHDELRSMAAAARDAQTGGE